MSIPQTWPQTASPHSPSPPIQVRSFAIASQLEAGVFPREAKLVHLKASIKLCIEDLEEQRFDRTFNPKKSSSTISSSCTTVYGLESLKFMEERDSGALIDLPTQKGPSWYRRLRWASFTAYQRLFSVILCANAVAMTFVLKALVMIPPPHDNRIRPELAKVLTAVSANLTAAIAIRNEHVINVLFRVFVNHLSPKAPLRLRRLCAKIYHFGGVHSGAGVVAVLWYAIYTFASMYDYVRTGYPGKQSPLMVLTSCIWTLMMGLLVAAHPQFRTRMHDWFEISHRVCGWAVLALFWVQTFVFCIQIARTGNEETFLALIGLPTFWMIMVMTLAVLYPWARMRKVQVRCEKLSDHAIRMHVLPKNGRPMPSCRVIAISHQPVRETHKFATIPDPDGGPEYSMVVSKAGDWTSAIIRNPPQKIWIKGSPAWGVLRVATLFDPVLIVATGSGIGPCLGLFNGFPSLPCRVIWQTRNPIRTYGAAICAAVRRADQDAVIIDSDAEGRQDILRLAVQVYRQSRAEAVIVISNTQLTNHVVHELESRGIPAYGPIWDS